MSTPKLAGPAIALTLLAGCGPDAPRSQPPGSAQPSAAAAQPTAPPTPQQLQLAETIAAAGVRVPPLHRVLRQRSHEIHGFTIGIADALAMWERLRAVTDQTGYYPLIVAELEALADDGLETSNPADVLAESERMDAQAWFDKQRELDPDLDETLDRGEWQDAEPTDRFYILSPDFHGHGPGEVEIALIPTTRPWEVPAFMGFGGWNACPAPEAHVAIHRSWHERFGAEIVTMAGDIIEMRVLHPPQDRATAESLAMEQFHYTAGDLVYQGTGTLLALASTLKAGTSWFFWWD